MPLSELYLMDRFDLGVETTTWLTDALNAINTVCPVFVLERYFKCLLCNFSFGCCCFNVSCLNELVCYCMTEL